MSPGTLDERLAVDRHEGDDDRERDQDRDDRPGLAQPAPERDLLGGDLFLDRAADGRVGGAFRRRVARGARVRELHAGADLHGSRGYRLARSVRHRPMVLSIGPAHDGPSAGPPSSTASGWMRPRPRDRWTTLAIGVMSRTTKLARPGTSSAEASAASSPAGVDGSPSRAVYATADLEDRVGVGDGDDRSLRVRARTPSPARCRCRRAARCGPRPSRRAARAPPSPRRAGATRAADRTDAGCRPEPPCSRAAAIVSTARQPGRDGPLEEDADEVAVGGLDLLADDDRQPVGRSLARPRAPHRSDRGP